MCAFWITLLPLNTSIQRYKVLISVFFLKRTIQRYRQVRCGYSHCRLLSAPGSSKHCNIEDESEFSYIN
jgi:hypothetical protein